MKTLPYAKKVIEFCFSDDKVDHIGPGRYPVWETVIEVEIGEEQISTIMAAMAEYLRDNFNNYDPAPFILELRGHIK